MVKDKIASLVKDIYSKLEEEAILGKNIGTLVNEPTERNNLTFEKVLESIRSFEEDIKIPVRKSSMYPFTGSDGKTYVGVAFKKVKPKDELNKSLNRMIERCDLDGKCMVSGEVYEHLKEKHSDKFKFE